MVSSPTEQALISYIVLLINLGFSLFGSTITNQATSYFHKRPHNFIRLVNEALTRLYLSYFAFFLVLVLVLLNQNAGTLRIIADIFIAISFLFVWSASLYITSIFSDLRYIKRVHNCKIKDNQCETLANFRQFMKVCSINLIFAFLTFIAVTAILLFSPLFQEPPK
jgi:hypothetical protein